MYFHFFDVLVSIGFLNACVFSAVIFFKINRTATDKLSATIVLILGLLCLKILLHTLGIWQMQFFRYFPLGIDLWLPPLLWLYVLALTNPQRLHKALITNHLALPLVFLFYAIGVYVITVFINNLEIKSAVANRLWFDEIKAIEDALSVILGIYYGILAYHQLKKYQLLVESYISDTAVPTYLWLRNLFFTTSLVLLFLGAMLVSQYLQFTTFVPLQVFYFYLVFLIYVFGFFGFRHQAFQVSIDLISKKSDTLAHPEKMNLLERLHQWMEAEKPYLEPDLHLNQCAIHLQCSAQILSEAINVGKNKNFRDYINQFRVEEFKQQIVQTNLQQETIVGVAYACGFNSEASFYRIFKEKTGLTPKAFLRIKS